MKNKLLLVLSLVAAVLVVALSAVLGILKSLAVINVAFTVFEIVFTVLTYGFGIIVLIYGLVGKGGYEKAIGLILLDVAVVCTLIFAKVFWVVTIIVAFALIAITALLMFLFYAKNLRPERTNEKEDFVSYTEVLEKQKAEEKANEEPMPEIKSFKK